VRHAGRVISGSFLPVRVAAAIGRYKRVIGDGLRPRTFRRQTTEVAITVCALNRVLELGRPNCLRIA